MPCEFWEPGSVVTWREAWRGYEYIRIPVRVVEDDVRQFVFYVCDGTRFAFPPRSCEHGTWTFAGSDSKRGASKWRCPTGECAPKSRWIKADRLHPLVPRETKRWHDLYRGRAAVEREFGRLKHEYGLAPIRVRGLTRVQLHADLTMLTRLSQAPMRARSVPLAA